jgi:hypothetical protein
MVRTYGGDMPDSDAGKTDLADNTEESTSSSRSPYELTEVKESTSSSLDQFCRECSLKFKDPQPDQLVMYLHAYSYKVINFYIIFIGHLLYRLSWYAPIMRIRYLLSCADFV